MALSYEFVTRAERLEHIANEIAEAEVVALDLETTPKKQWLKRQGAAFSPLYGESRIASFNTGKGRYVIDLWQTGGLGPIAKALHNPTAAVGKGRPVMVLQNCLTADSRVLLADGSKVRLDKLVRDKHPGPVLCLNEATGEIESKPIVGWIKAPVRPWEDWLRVQVRGKGCLRLTKDHVVLTRRGRVPAADLRVGDEILTRSPALTAAQRDLIFGSLLGDASIVLQAESKARSPLFQVSHSEPQRAYVEFKARVMGDLFKGLSRGKPAKRGFGARTGVVLSCARTRSDARLWPVRDACIREGKKTLTPEWLAELTWASLAVWYCDDGSLAGRGVSVCVSKFGETGIPLLVSHLEGLGLPVGLTTREDGHVYLHMAGSKGERRNPAMTGFWENIAPWVPPCMAYKLPEEYRELASETRWMEPEAPKVGADTVIEIRPLAREPGDARRHGGFKREGRGLAQYCLTVQDNPNFFVEGLSVSNCKFDQRYLLHEYGIELWPVFDTFRASAMIHNGKGLGHNLWDLYDRELQMEPSVEDLGGSNWGSTVLTQQQLDYAADDIIYLPHLRDSLKPKLARLGLNRVAQIEFGAILPEAVVELNGFPFDSDAWLALAATNRAARDNLGREILRLLPNPSGQLSLMGSEEWMYGPDCLSDWADSVTDEMEEAEGDDSSGGFQAAWYEVQAQLRRAARPKGSKKTAHFNPDSQKQLLASLRRMGGPLKDLPDTSEATLSLYAAKLPAIKKLLDYREAATRCKSFGPEYLQHVSPVTGRIHLDYYPLLVTGRYAHRNPNLGQIPRYKPFRKCFKVKPGRRMTLCDYSMVEIVLMAELTGDRTLCRLLREGRDVHRYVASRILNKPEADITKEERQQAKPADFGFIYGLGAERFVSYALVGYNVVLTLEQSHHIRNTFFGEFPDIADWQEYAIANGKRTHMTRSILGRLRYTGEKEHNEYLNTPDQASGADGLKMALRDLHFALRNKFGPDAVKMVHHVHDETILEHADDPDLEKEVQKVQSSVMVEAMSRIVTKVPVVAESASGYSWADKG